MMYASLIDAITTRRGAIQSMAGAAAMFGAMGGAQAATDKKASKREPIDFKDPAQNLKAFLKVSGDINPKNEKVGWFGGTLYAVRGTDKLVPLIGVSGFGVMRIEPQGGNIYHVFNREFATYTDLKTGDILEQWKNPLTDEVVDVVPIKNKIVNAKVSPVMEQDFDGHKVSFPFSPPWIVQGDKAFSLLEVHAAFPNPMKVDTWPRESAGPINRTSEMFQRMVSLSDLENPDLTSVDYVGTWTRVSPWLPWMLNGQMDGHILYRCFMNRTGRPENLPKNLLTYVEKKYPEFLQAPGPETWGKPNDSSFTVYMAERKPQPKKG
jgi:hypothetical protein